MKYSHHALLLGALTGLMAACSDGLGPEAERGTLNTSTQVLGSGYTPAFKRDFANNPTYRPLAMALEFTNTGVSPSAPTVAYALPCDFSIHKINYKTVGAAGEATTATAAVMVPNANTGHPACTASSYPVVLAAHGTDYNKAADVSNISTSSEGALYATMFAAQGFVVVAPNYAGYDQSTLAYHPYLILEQQAKDMQDALTAAGKSGLYASNGKVFVTGYSQGGAVAMATQRAMQLSNDSRLVASAPLSGPYAMLKFGDVIMGGKVNRGGTIFTPLLIEGAQKAYGDLYQNITDIYNAPFSATVPGLLPGFALDNNALFGQLAVAPLLTAKADGSEATPPYGVAATGALLTTSARSTYLADAATNPLGNSAANPLPGKSDHGMRRALLKNDLRSGWVPNKPTLLCGADNDPSVFFDENTSAFKDYVDAKQPTNLVSVLNLRAGISGASDPFAALKQGFISAGLNIPFNTALTASASVHSNMAPFCYLAAYGFFRPLR